MTGGVFVFRELLLTAMTERKTPTQMHLVSLQLPTNDKTEVDKNGYGINILQLNNSSLSSRAAETEIRRDNSIACVIESILANNQQR